MSLNKKQLGKDEQARQKYNKKSAHIKPSKKIGRKKNC